VLFYSTTGYCCLVNFGPGMEAGRAHCRGGGIVDYYGPSNVCHGMHFGQDTRLCYSPPSSSSNAVAS
jgi:hypothetical protein